RNSTHRTLWTQLWLLRVGTRSSLKMPKTFYAMSCYHRQRSLPQTYPRQKTLPGKKLRMKRICKRPLNKSSRNMALSPLSLKGDIYKEMPLTFYMMETRFTPFPLVELIQKIHTVLDAHYPLLLLLI